MVVVAKFAKEKFHMAGLKFVQYLVLFRAALGSFTAAPLVDGIALHHDLHHGEIVCRSLAIPSSSARVHMKASVVGLTGNPNVFGGWTEKEIMDRVSSNLAPPNLGGYHILSEFHEVPADRTSFFLCVTTFATQGSDFLLTATVTDASAWFPAHVRLMDGFPTVWRLDLKGPNFIDFMLPIEEGAVGNLTVALSPIYGEVDLKISDCDSWEETLAVSASIGPDLVSVPIPSGLAQACMRVHTTQPAATSEFALVASTNVNGPFLAQSIPMAGTHAFTPNVRAMFNPSTDLSLTVRGQASQVPLTVSADTVAGGSAWTSSSGRLEITKSALQDRQGDVVYIKIHEGEKFTMTLTSHGTVEQLQDGRPLTVTVDSESRFRDFRVWVPAGVQFLTIQGDSSSDGSGLGIFASTVRTSHDPRGYRWNSMTGTNEMLFATDPDVAAADPDLLFLDCTDCYVYVSVKSCVVSHGVCKETGMSSFTLTASTDQDVFQLQPMVAFRSVFSGKKVFLIPKMDAESTEPMVVYVKAESGVRAGLTLDETTAIAPEDGVCSDGICRLEVDSSFKTAANVFLVVESAVAGEVVKAEITVAQDPILLKNHHLVAGRVGLPTQDKYQFRVPAEVEAMIDFKSDQATLTVCEAGDCQSVTGSGRLHFKSSSALHTLSAKVASDTENSVSYEMTPSFFSLVSNSLRVGYKPVSANVGSHAKLSWEVGYEESAEWIISAASPSSGLSMCVTEDAARCCTVPCELQGFGRQQIVVENTGDSSSTVTLTSSSLPVLLESQSVAISDRKSEVFKIPSRSWPARVETDGSVAYMIGSSAAEELAAPPADSDVGRQNVFVRIAGGTVATLHKRHDLQLNSWAEQSVWNRVTIQNLVGTGLIVRTERCLPDSTSSLSVNRNSVDGLFLDLPFVEGEFNVDSSGGEKFRIGLHSGPVVVFTIESFGDETFAVFQAPKNAAGTLYRSLSLAGGQTVPSQCVMEQSAETIHGSPVSCNAGETCLVPLVAGDFVSVAADGGTEFGLFQPVSMTTGLPATAASSSSGWIWFIAKLVIVVAILRILKQREPRVRAWLRGKEKSLHEELLETGTHHGYKQMQDRPSPIRFGTEMTNRSNYKQSY